ncbi:D-alanyl-D-alanine carboxypeptidase family protein [Bacillus kwashiorkori]|uniref:D-alanyl-D-alanine carboxypeptidase family protein n=1 Tax=Bacillus kwashiorkori TaxID=1522318 RepID=UPI0007858777|nr:D-alanyl-D-alanine carboxypeptidase family protein [Bacillus kwashiorkori]
MKKSVIILITTVFLSLAILPKASFAEEQTMELAEKARSAILIEQNTGTVLYEKNSEEQLPPASMTKIMTMLLVMEAVKEGKLKLTEKVRTSENAASMGGSQIFLEPGEEMTAEQLLLAVAVGSANDASVALAERIAGSEQAFVKMMNEKAEQLGLKNTKFQNTTGLPAKDHYSSASDMAIMAKELLKYEEITKFTGTYESYLREDTDKKFWLVNTNRLIRFYPGVDGLKTGFTREAMYCLTATAKKDDMRIVAVVFGAPTPKDRNKQISAMFDFAFNQFETKPFYKKNEVVAEAKIKKGQKPKINAVTNDSIALLSRKGEKLEDVKKEIVLDKTIQAPIKKGDTIGKIMLKKDNKLLAEGTLVASEDVKSASWWTFYKRTFGIFTKIKAD